MKPLFGIDITLDKQNETYNGKEYVTRSTAAHKMANLEEKTADVNRTVEESKLPIWVRIIKFICGAAAAIILLATLRGILDVGFEKALSNAKWLIFAGLACALVWVVLTVLSKDRSERVAKESGLESMIGNIKDDIETMYEELGVPTTACNVDILMFKYEVKDGEAVPKAVGLQMYVFFAVDAKMFVDGDTFNVADLENVYTFKLDELKSIKTVDKRISIPSWNKETPFNKGEYKQYKLKTNSMGAIFFKPYHILVGERDGETFGIYFPCYELPTVERLTGLTAEA